MTCDDVPDEEGAGPYEEPHEELPVESPAASDAVSDTLEVDSTQQCMFVGGVSFYPRMLPLRPKSAAPAGPPPRVAPAANAAADVPASQQEHPRGGTAEATAVPRAAREPAAAPAAAAKPMVPPPPPPLLPRPAAAPAAGEAETLTSASAAASASAPQQQERMPPRPPAPSIPPASLAARAQTTAREKSPIAQQQQPVPPRVEPKPQLQPPQGPNSPPQSLPVPDTVPMSFGPPSQHVHSPPPRPATGAVPMNGPPPEVVTEPMGTAESRKRGRDADDPPATGCGATSGRPSGGDDDSASSLRWEGAASSTAGSVCAAGVPGSSCGAFADTGVVPPDWQDSSIWPAPADCMGDGRACFWHSKKVWAENCRGCGVPNEQVNEKEYLCATCFEVHARIQNFTCKGQQCNYRYALARQSRKLRQQELRAAHGLEPPDFEPQASGVWAQDFDDVRPPPQPPMDEPPHYPPPEQPRMTQVPPVQSAWGPPVPERTPLLAQPPLRQPPPTQVPPVHSAWEPQPPPQASAAFSSAGWGPCCVRGVVVGAGAACVHTIAVCAAWPDPAVEAATAAGSELDGVLCVDWGLCDTSAAVASASAAAGARADAAGGVVCAAPVLCVESLLAACTSAVCAAPGALRYSAGVGEREDSGTEALRLVGQAGQVHECQRFPLGR